MLLLKNAQAFKNWYLLYLWRYGFIRDEFELISREGERISVRPWAADVGITKSVFAKKNYTNNFVSIHADSIVVDVGANIGAFSLFASRTARQVFAFEPEPDNFACLCKNVEQNSRKNITPLDMAVTQATGEAEFRVAGKRHSGAHSFFLEKFEKKITVKTTSLSDFMKKESLERIHFLKLDCEGAEVNIIKGLKADDAEKIEQMAMEYHGNETFTADNAAELLKDLGFHLRFGKNRGYIYARR